MNPEVVANIFDVAYEEIYGDTEDDLQPMSSCVWDDENEFWLFTQHDINGNSYNLRIFSDLDMNFSVNDLILSFNMGECYKILFKEIGFD